MMKILLFVLFLISVFEQSVHATVIEKYTVDQVINDKWVIKNNYNTDREKTGQDPVEISQNLMDLAQKESERLAKLKKLSKPAFKLNTPYKAYSSKITGVIKINQDLKYVGTQICYGNTIHYSYHFVDLQSTCEYFSIPITETKEMGFGAAKDTDGTIYSVVIQSLNDSKKNQDSDDEEDE